MLALKALQAAVMVVQVCSSSSQALFRAGGFARMCSEICQMKAFYCGYPTWIPREVTLPGLCPSGVRERRAWPGDVQSLSTTLEMKLGFESAPAYSYSFSESCGR